METIHEPDAERTLRSVRRAVRGFRLIFYPGAVLVAFLLLTGRGDADVPVFMTGTTTQGGGVELRLEDGQPARLLVDITARCPSGDWRFKWSHGPEPLEHGRLTIRETTTRHYDYHRQTSRRTITLDARLDDGILRGTVTAVERFDGPDWGAYDCLSGVVSFSAWVD